MAELHGNDKTSSCSKTGQFCVCRAGGYEAVCDSAFAWKSGQELRPNDLTATDLTRLKHGNSALASKDMKKSQGGFGRTFCLIVETGFQRVLLLLDLLVGYALYVFFLPECMPVGLK